VSLAGTTWTIDSGVVTSAKIADDTIVNGDISTTAEIAVSKLADGAARQLLQTDAAGTGVEWTSNVDIPGTLDVVGVATFDSRIITSAASGPAPVTNAPANLYLGSSDFTDTTTAASGTQPHATLLTINDTNFAATNANVTYTNASALFIQGQPNPSTNVTITNAYSLYINRGTSFFGGNISFPLGTAALPSIYPDTDTNTGLWSPAADTLAVSNGGSETLRTDSSRRLLIGTSSSRILGAARLVQIEGGSATTTSLSLFRNSNDVAAPVIAVGKSRGTVSGSNTIVQNSDTLGQITFYGADGTAPIAAASIAASCDGTPGTNDMPGRFTFSTTADGASTVTERMRIDNAGAIFFPSVGTTASAANAFLNSGSSPANQLLRSTSSLRYKTGIENIEEERSAAILGFRPVWYRSTAKADRSDWSWYGLIAEEVAEIEPRLVHWTYLDDAYEEVDGEKQLKLNAEMVPDGVQYDRLTVLLLDVVKRQQQAIETLEARVAVLEGQ
jgi:hypothetical protein